MLLAHAALTFSASCMQQAGALERDSALRLRLITGMTTEQWKSDEWKQQLDEYDAIVMTRFSTAH